MISLVHISNSHTLILSILVLLIAMIVGGTIGAVLQIVHGTPYDCDPPPTVEEIPLTTPFPSVDPGEGYRWLKNGEPIALWDEYEYREGFWGTTCRDVGELVVQADVERIRRAVKPVIVKAAGFEGNYRKLDIGEVVEDGDLWFCYQNEWKKAFATVGSRVGKRSLEFFRKL